MSLPDDFGVVLVTGGCGYLGSYPSYESKPQVKYPSKGQNPAVKAFAYTSSDSAIVDAPQDSGQKLTEEEARLFTENSKDANTYSITKATADAAVLAANDPSNLYTVTLRVPGLYRKNNYSMEVLLGAIKKNQHMMQVGENKRKFGLLFIESAAMAHVLAARALIHEANADYESSTIKDAQMRSISNPKKVNGEACFNSDGVNMPYFTFARKIVAMAGHPVADNEVKALPYRLILGITILSE